MALYRTDAVVLGHRNLGEADKVLTLFSPDKGKIHVVARGVRRPRSPILAGTQLFCYSNFLILENKSLDSISQCEIKESFFRIRQSLEAVAYGLYFAELLRASTPLEDKNKQLFDFFLKTMYLLQESENPEVLSRIYEIKLLALNGFTPELFRCVNCGKKNFDIIYFSPSMGGILCRDCIEKDKKAVNITTDTLNVMRKMLTKTYEELEDIEIKEYTKQQLQEILELFIEYHIDKKLKTTQFIKDVQSFHS